MTFNISNFKSGGLVYGGARPSLFTVELTPPQNINPNSAEKFTFLCRAAELPASRVSEIPVSYFGRRIKVAGQRDFQDWAVSVMNDEDFAVRSMFEKWSNAINKHVANVRDSAFATENYKIDMACIQYSKTGEPIRSYTLVGAFPTNIGPIALNWEQANQIEEFQVNFAYDYWVPEIESSTSIEGITNPYREDT